MTTKWTHNRLYFLIAFAIISLMGLVAGCDCGDKEPPLPPGQVRLSLSLRTPAYQRFTRLRDVTFTIQLPGKDTITRTYPRLLLGQPLVTDIVVPGDADIQVQAKGTSWDGKSNWSGKWNFALPASLTEHIGVLTVAKDGKLGSFLPMLFASGTKDEDTVRVWTRPPTDKTNAPKIDWKGNITFTSKERTGSPTTPPSSTPDATPPTQDGFHIRDGKRKSGEPTTFRVDYESNGKPIDWLQLDWDGKGNWTHKSRGNVPIFVRSLDVPKLSYKPGETTTFSAEVLNPAKKELFITWTDTCGGTFGKADVRVEWTAPKTDGECRISLTIKDKYDFSTTLHKEVQVVTPPPPPTPNEPPKEPTTPKLVGTFTPPTIDVGVQQVYKLVFEDTTELTKATLFQSCAPNLPVETQLTKQGQNQTEITLTWTLKDEGRPFPPTCDVDILVTNKDGGNARISTSAKVRYPAIIEQTIGAQGGEIIAYHPSPFFQAQLQQAGVSTTNPVQGAGVIRMHLLIPPGTVANDTKFKLDATTPGPGEDPKMVALGRLFPDGFKPTTGTFRFFFFPPTELNPQVGDTFEHRVRANSTASFQVSNKAFVTKQDLSVEVELDGFSDHAAFATEPPKEGTTEPTPEPAKEPTPDAAPPTDSNPGDIAPDQPAPTPTVEPTKRFTNKGDTGIVFVVPDGEDPSDFDVTSDCGKAEDIRKEVRDGKTVFVLTVTSIPARPECKINVTKNGRSNQTTRIPFGFETDQSDDIQRVKQYINGLMQNIVINYVVGNYISKANTTSIGNVRYSYKEVFERSAPQTFSLKLKSLTTGTVSWPQGFSVALGAFSAFFHTNARVQLTIDSVDQAGGTIKINTDGMDLTKLNAAPFQFRQIRVEFTNASNRKSVRSFSTPTFAFQITKDSLLITLPPGTTGKTIDFTDFKKGDNIALFADITKQEDQLSFTTKAANETQDVTFEQPVLPWTAGTDFPNQKWLDDHFSLNSRVFRSTERNKDTHQQQFASSMRIRGGLQTGKDTQAIDALYSRIKIGQVAVMERWFCASKQQGKTITKRTHMDLIPPDTIRRIEAYNTLLSKRFRSPGRIFSIPQSTDNYIRVLTWGGSYIGNKSNSPLDEPNCQDYTGSQSLFRIDNNNQFLDARTVIDAKTVDAMDIVQGLFPETCKTSSDGTCTNTKLARAPKIPWTTLRTQAQLLGLQDAFTSDFGIDKTDGADWCTRLRKQWSGIVPTGSFVGQTCQYKHVGGIGLFDLPRQIALVDSLRWMHARLTTGQSPFSTYRAFPMEFSCSDVGRPSSRRLDPSDVCQTNNPDAQTILATANANYLASLLAIQTPQCNDPKESDLAALRSPEYSAQNLPPIPPDSCSSSRQKAGHRDIGRYEVNELMPGNKLPGTRALFATCHETKKTTRTINGKRVKCTDTSFKTSCSISRNTGPFIGLGVRNKCTEPRIYHNEVQLHDLRFKTALETCQQATSVHLANFQFCALHHITRAGKTFQEQDWKTGFPLDDTVFCEQFDFNKNSRFDLGDARFFFNFLHLAVKKHHASFVQLFPRFFGRAYPKAMLDELRPKIAPLIDKALKSTLGPSKGFDLIRDYNSLGERDIQTKYYPEGTQLPRVISPHTNKMIFLDAVQIVLWQLIADKHDANIEQWLELLVRLPRQGMTRSSDGTRVITSINQASSGLVLANMCAMILTGRGPGETGPVSSGTSQLTVDQLATQWARSIAPAINSTDPTRPGTFGGPSPSELALRSFSNPNPKTAMVGSRRVSGTDFSSTPLLIRVKLDNQRPGTTNPIFQKAAFVALRHRPILASKPTDANTKVIGSSVLIGTRFDDDTFDKDEPITVTPPTGITLAPPTVLAIVGGRTSRITAKPDGKGFTFIIPKGASGAFIESPTFTGVNALQGLVLNLQIKQGQQVLVIASALFAPNARRSPDQGPGAHKTIASGFRWHHDGSVTLSKSLLQLKGFGQSYPFDITYSTQRQQFDRAIHEYLITARNEGNFRIGLAGSVNPGVGWGHTWDYRLLPFFDGNTVKYVLVTPYGIASLKPVGTFDPKGTGPFVFVPERIDQLTTPERSGWLASVVIRVDASGEAKMEDKRGRTWSFSLFGLLEKWEQFGMGARLELTHEPDRCTIALKGKQASGDATGWTLTLDQQQGLLTTSVSAKDMVGVSGPSLQVGAGGSLSLLTGDDRSVWSFSYDANGLIEGIGTPTGGSLSLTYDDKQRLANTTLTPGANDRFAANGPQGITPVTGPLTHTFAYTNSQSTHTDAIGRVFTYALDPQGRISTIRVAADGQTTTLATYQYATSNGQPTLLVTEYKDHENNLFTWKYTEDKAKLDSKDLFFGDKQTNGLRGTWMLLSEVGTPGGKRTIKHSTSGLSRGLVQSMTEPWGTTQYTYQNRLLTKIEAPGQTVTLTRDTAGNKAVVGQVLSEANARTKRTTCFLYNKDASKGGNSIGMPSGRAIGEPGTCPTTVTNDSKFRTFTITYNAAGHATETASPLTGGTTTFGRLADGRVTDYKGQTTWSQQYFGMHRKTRTNLGNTKDTQYGSLLIPVGQHLSVSGGKRCRRYILDRAGRTIATIATTGEITLFTYDALDRVIQRRYPTDVRVTDPCSQNDASTLAAFLKNAQSAYTETVAYTDNTETTTRGDVSTTREFKWFLNDRRLLIKQTRFEASNGSPKPIRQMQFQRDGRGLLLAIGEYGHTQFGKSELTTRACVTKDATAFATTSSVNGGSLALFNERYMERDGAGWITKTCLANGGTITTPYNPRDAEQTYAQNGTPLLVKREIKDIWGRTINVFRGNIEIKRHDYERGGAANKRLIHRFHSVTGQLFPFREDTLDNRGRIASSTLFDVDGTTPLETITYTYDNAGRLLKRTQEDAKTKRKQITSHAWSDANQSLKHTIIHSTQGATGPAKDNKTIETHTNGYGRVVERIERRFGTVTQHARWQYHGWGRPALMELPLRQVHRVFSYDPSGRIQRVEGLNLKDNLTFGELTWTYGFSTQEIKARLFDPKSQKLGASTLAMTYQLDHAGRPLRAEGPLRVFVYRYDARGHLRCKSVRVAFENQTAGGRWDATYDAMSRRTTLKAFSFGNQGSVVHCDQSAPSTATQSLAYTYSLFGFLKETKGTIDGQALTKQFDYLANGLLKSESLKLDGYKDPSQLTYTYNPHGLLLQIALKASTPSNDDILRPIADMTLAYGGQNAWWNQRSHASMTINEMQRFRGFNRIGDSRFNQALDLQKKASRIFGKNFAILKSKLSLPDPNNPKATVGQDFGRISALFDETGEVRMDVFRHYDAHGRLHRRERLLFTRARNKTPGHWPFDDKGNVQTFQGTAGDVEIVNNGQLAKSNLKTLLSCNNTIDSYRQGIAAGISPKHPHFQSIEDPTTAFSSFADSTEYAKVVGDWGVPLRRSCEQVLYDANDRPISIHQRMLFVMPQFWVDNTFAKTLDERGRRGIQQLIGKKTFTFDASNQLTKLDVQGMLFERAEHPNIPFAPQQEWLDNLANIKGSHQMTYPGKIGSFGNVQFVHTRYWHSPQVMGGLLGWAFPEARETTALVQIPGSQPTIERRSALFSRLYDPVGRLFAVFNPPSGIPSPADFSKVAFAFNNRSQQEQDALKQRFKDTFLESKRNVLNVALLAGEQTLERIDKSWYGKQTSELPCPTNDAPDTIRCTFYHQVGLGAGALHAMTGRIMRPLRFVQTLDQGFTLVSVLPSESNDFSSIAVTNGHQPGLVLDRDVSSGHQYDHWNQMIHFQPDEGKRQLQAQSGTTLASLLRPNRLSLQVATVPDGDWMSPMSHVTPLNVFVNLTSLPPYTLDPHTRQLQEEQTLALWGQVIQQEKNFLKDILALAQNDLKNMTLGLGVASALLPALGPAFAGSAAAMATLRGVLVTIELAQVAILSLEIAAIIQSDGLHQVSGIQWIMLASGIASTIVAGRMGLKPGQIGLHSRKIYTSVFHISKTMRRTARASMVTSRFARQQLLKMHKLHEAIFPMTNLINNTIGTSMLAYLAADGMLNGFKDSHREQLLFFVGNVALGGVVGHMASKRAASKNPTTKKQVVQTHVTIEERLAFGRIGPHKKTKARTQHTHQKQIERKERLNAVTRPFKREMLRIKNTSTRVFKNNVPRIRSLWLKPEVAHNKHRTSMAKEVTQLGAQLLAFFKKHGTLNGGYIRNNGQLNLPLMVNFLKTEFPGIHGKLQTTDPAFQAIFKSVASILSKEIRKLGVKDSNGNPIDSFAALSIQNQNTVYRTVTNEISRQIKSVKENGNNPEGWAKAFSVKDDSVGKDLIKFAISRHARLAGNKKFYFNGKSAKEFWEKVCDRKWSKVKDAYEGKLTVNGVTHRLTPEEMYLMREFRFLETRKFINEAATDLNICQKSKDCAEVVFAPPAGSDGPTSDFDVSWTVLINGVEDPVLSAQLVAHATRKYIKAIGSNAEEAFEHGLFVRPLASFGDFAQYKAIGKDVLKLQQAGKQQIDEALAMYIRNLDPGTTNVNANFTKMKSDFTTLFGNIKGSKLDKQLDSGFTKFQAFNTPTNPNIVQTALKRLVSCDTPACNNPNANDAQFKALLLEADGKTFKKDAVLLALKKQITGCTNNTCTDGVGQADFKTFATESNGTITLTPKGKGIINDFMASLLTDELALKLRAIKNDPTLVQNSAAYNTKLAEIIDVDTQLKFFQPESYATVSSLVHIVEGIQKGRTINNNGFLGSLIENMGYERHYQTLGKGDKIQKYGVRVADALQRLINKRIADNDPNFNQLFTSSELDTLKSIVDRFNDTHKSNAGAQFQATDSFQRMQNDIATMYQLASKAINAIFK